MHENFRNIKGFTLVETILYMAIIGIALSSFVAFGMSISTSRSRVHAAQEVQANARIFMDAAISKIQYSDNIIAPASGEAGDTIVLDMPGGEITLSIEDGTAFIEDGTGRYPLISRRVEVANPVFNTIGSPGGPQSVSINFDMNYRNAGSREFTYMGSFRALAAPRNQ